jgi:hypothetical protein
LTARINQPLTAIDLTVIGMITNRTLKHEIFDLVLKPERANECAANYCQHQSTRPITERDGPVKDARQ